MEEKMTSAQRLFVTANYAFDYNCSPFNHVLQIDALSQYFEHRCGIEGYISDEEGDRVIEGSDFDILMDDLWTGFDNRDIPGVVKKYLLDYEMYEELVEYEAPLKGEALMYRDELLNYKRE